jgi:hypothetical protein
VTQYFFVAVEADLGYTGGKIPAKTVQQKEKLHKNPEFSI